MYPSAELNLLAARKAVLRRQIAAQRARCVAAAATLSRPLGWIDRALAIGRQWAPVAYALLRSVRPEAPAGSRHTGWAEALHGLSLLQRGWNLWHEWGRKSR